MIGYDATFEEARQNLMDLWDEIKHSASDDFLVEIIDEIEKEKRYRELWHVPISTMKSHQVLSRKPIVSHIRNHI